jgi:hypothetical protein
MGIVLVIVCLAIIGVVMFMFAREGGIHNMARSGNLA